MIAIVDYGLGNVKAFANVYERLNIPACIARKVDDLKEATKVILPGVGSFDHAMIKLNQSGMRDALDKLVFKKQVPVLGICVGMQMLAQASEEGVSKGLGWIDGVVKKLDLSVLKSATKLPHMGWNTIDPNLDNPLLAELNGNSRFYFLHSYYFHCKYPDSMIAITNYGMKFASAVNHRNIYGVQFHPEKSHRWGIQLLKNFADI
jgi:glutamine amidotransferase